jgi:hypothetical protein
MKEGGIRESDMEEKRIHKRKEMTEGYGRGTNMEEKRIGKRKGMEEGRKLRGKDRGGTDTEEVRIQNK